MDNTRKRFSRFADNSDIFTPYVMKMMSKDAVEAECQGLLAYFGVVGDGYSPTIFTANGHLMHAVLTRMGLSYASEVMGNVIRAVEGCTGLGTAILDAADRAYEQDRVRATVALWIEEDDIFCYLHAMTNDDTIHIATIVCGEPIYFVDEHADLICKLGKDGSFIQGMENIPNFKVSMHVKCKGEGQHS